MSKFLVNVKHACGTEPWHGNHVFTVKPSPGREGFFYANASRFGCSKDYTSEHNAITSMLAEHACTAVKITKL